jgi:hypothetical protein
MMPQPFAGGRYARCRQQARLFQCYLRLKGVDSVKSLLISIVIAGFSAVAARSCDAVIDRLSGSQELREDLCLSLSMAFGLRSAIR